MPLEKPKNVSNDPETSQKWCHQNGQKQPKWPKWPKRPKRPKQPKRPKRPKRPKQSKRSKRPKRTKTARTTKTAEWPKQPKRPKRPNGQSSQNRQTANTITNGQHTCKAANMNICERIKYDTPKIVFSVVNEIPLSICSPDLRTWCVLLVC